LIPWCGRGFDLQKYSRLTKEILPINKTENGNRADLHIMQRKHNQPYPDPQHDMAFALTLAGVVMVVVYVALSILLGG
jgi:hypothetical protein